MINFGTKNLENKKNPHTKKRLESLTASWRFSRFDTTHETSAETTSAAGTVAPPSGDETDLKGHWGATSQQHFREATSEVRNQWWKSEIKLKYV